MSSLRFLILLSALFLSSCGSRQDAAKDLSSMSGQELASIYCGSCHLPPDPSLLDRETWATGVLPNMAYRLGQKIGNPPYTKMQSAEMMRVLQAGIFPMEPVIDSVSWTKIFNYYVEQAPPQPVKPPARPDIPRDLKLWSAQPLAFPRVGGPLTTMLSWNAQEKKLFAGDGEGDLLAIDARGSVEKIGNFRNPVTAVYSDKKGGRYVLSIGIIFPNDMAGGVLSYMAPDGQIRVLLQELPRPVDLAVADLNGDEREDLVVCGFGHYLGRFSWYEQLADNQYREHVLLNVPGAIKTYVLDLDGNGLQDIVTLMAQGDEGIFAFYNEGSGNFRQERLLRFPPAYGSDYFELVDMDGDKDLDIIYTNGDNADLSMILKAYHGVRIFENDGKRNFTEKYFFPLYGAYKALPRDFDGDGDLDIAAISFFPDFENHPEEGFVYLDRQSTPDGSLKFQAHTLPESVSGRWLVMEAADFDGNGTTDLALGSFAFSPSPAPPDLRRTWMEGGVNTLLLWKK